MLMIVFQFNNKLNREDIRDERKIENFVASSIFLQYFHYILHNLVREKSIPVGGKVVCIIKIKSLSIGYFFVIRR